LALGTVSYHPYTLDDAIHGARAAGYSHVEIFATVGDGGHITTDMDDRAIEALLDRLGQNSLKVSGLNASIGLITEERADNTRTALSLAKKLGAGIVTNSIAGPDSHEEDLDLFMAQIGGIADHAEAVGVTLAIEVHGDKTGNGKLISEVVRDVGHPRVKINYDTGNCVFYGDAWPYEDLEIAVPDLAHIHFKDKIGGKGVWNFPPPGSGEVDFKRVVDILDRGGFQGPMSVEIEFDETGWPPVEKTHEAAHSARRHLLEIIDSLS
jgi:sugar phosphate isomerase/epimerase